MYNKRKIAIYPGSFNPFHIGHLNIVEKALKIFDKVIIAKGVNPTKNTEIDYGLRLISKCVSDGINKYISEHKVVYHGFSVLLVDMVKELQKENGNSVDYAIIKGIRNGNDLEDEKAQLYWNEDLGLEIPTFYIMADREYTHISSSAIRQIETFKEAKEENG